MSEKSKEESVKEILLKLWKVPLYDIEGQKKVLRKIIEENELSKSVIQNLRSKLSAKTREVNRHWEDSYEEVHFERER